MYGIDVEEMGVKGGKKGEKGTRVLSNYLSRVCGCQM